MTIIGIMEGASLVTFLQPAVKDGVHKINVRNSIDVVVALMSIIVVVVH